MNCSVNNSPGGHFWFAEAIEVGTTKLAGSTRTVISNGAGGLISEQVYR